MESKMKNLLSKYEKTDLIMVFNCLGLIGMSIYGIITHDLSIAIIGFALAIFMSLALIVKL